jgi:hypothetical protein
MLERQGKMKTKIGEADEGVADGVDSMMGRLNLLADVTDVVDMSDNEEEDGSTLVKWS